MSRHLVIVGFGPVSGYKYSRCIRAAMQSGAIEGYSVVDLESQRDTVQRRLAGLPAQPIHTVFIPDRLQLDDPEASLIYVAPFLRSRAKESNGSLKVVIATEPQAHESYLRHCMLEGYDTLTTKPLLVPMRDGVFDGGSIYQRTKDLLKWTERAKGQHSLIVLDRHHEIYEKRIRSQLAVMMEKLNVPITSINLKTASGVWNLPYEYALREDHPYKYGYGMLMHGAYHYVDLVTRLLQMNRRIYSEDEFCLRITGFAAFPKDQEKRLPLGIMNKLDNYLQHMASFDSGFPYGETDIVASFALCFRRSEAALCLGTIALEQTTPGMRSWGAFPEVPYNINGRLHCTDIDVRLGTLFAMNGHVAKTPISSRKDQSDLRGKNIGIVTSRSNALVAGTQEFMTEERITHPYGNSFSYAAESTLFRDWIDGRKTYSNLESHLPTAAVTAALARMIHSNGETIEIDFDFAEPDWPPITYVSNAVVHDDRAMQFAAYR